MRFLRLVACLLALCLLLPSAQAKEQLSDEQLRALLYELYEKQQQGSEFLVLPDDFRMPTIGLDCKYSLLIVGVDSDRPDMKGRSDTMVLAVLDARQGSLKLISFMRDLYVKIPGRGHNRLNAAYSYGGEALLRQTMAESFGVVADGYVAVNYSLMADLVDAIGGVELTVADNELKPLNGILGYYNYQRGLPEDEGRLTQAGERVLTGLQAMSYARIRKIDSDFERVHRQQRVLSAIYKQVKKMEAGLMAGILVKFIDRIATDLSLSDALGLVEDVMDMGELRIETLSIPIQRSFASKLINEAYYLVPNLRKNHEAIQAFLSQP